MLTWSLMGIENENNQKNVTNKSSSPNFIFFNEKNRQIRLIFDIET